MSISVSGIGAPVRATRVIEPPASKFPPVTVTSTNRVPSTPVVGEACALSVKLVSQPSTNGSTLIVISQTPAAASWFVATEMKSVAGPNVPRGNVGAS